MVPFGSTYIPKQGDWVLIKPDAIGGKGQPTDLPHVFQVMATPPAPHTGKFQTPRYLRRSEMPPDTADALGVCELVQSLVPLLKGVSKSAGIHDRMDVVGRCVVLHREDYAAWKERNVVPADKTYRVVPHRQPAVITYIPSVHREYEEATPGEVNRISVPDLCALIIARFPTVLPYGESSLRNLKARDGWSGTDRRLDLDLVMWVDDTYTAGGGGTSMEDVLRDARSNAPFASLEPQKLKNTIGGVFDAKGLFHGPAAGQEITTMSFGIKRKSPLVLSATTPILALAVKLQPSVIPIHPAPSTLAAPTMPTASTSRAICGLPGPRAPAPLPIPSTVYPFNTLKPVRGPIASALHPFIPGNLTPTFTPIVAASLATLTTSSSAKGKERASLSSDSGYASSSPAPPPPVNLQSLPLVDFIAHMKSADPDPTRGKLMGLIIIENVSILTLDDADLFIHRGTLVIDGSDIGRVLDRALTDEERRTGDIIIDGVDKVAMPGLVDLHFHTACAKGFNDHLPLWEYLDETWYPSIRALDLEGAKRAALASYLEAIKCGTTHVNDMYRHLPALAAAAAEIGLRATLANDVASEEHKLDSLVDNEKAFKTCHGTADGRVRVNIGIEWIPLADRALLQGAADLSSSLGTGIHIHLNESQTEVESTLERFGKRPTELAHECGLLGPRTVAAHVVHLSDEEIRLLATTGTHVSHNASSNAKLGNGVARLMDMCAFTSFCLAESVIDVRVAVAAGINVGLGHDAAECNNAVSLFQVMKFTSLIHRAVKQDASLLPPSQILRMATRNGSKALDTKAGMLAPGWKADIILLDLTKPAFCPLDPGNAAQLQSHIVFAADADVVSDSIIDGRVVMRDRELVFVDERQVLLEANETFQQVKVAMTSVTSKREK
ncbi:hypothetical protein RQP46_001994 [Phenoliferia psychrophenolica]